MTLNAESLATMRTMKFISGDELPSDMYHRLAHTANELTRAGVCLYEDFLHIFENQWLGAATPVAKSFGRDTGLPVSCYGLQSPNSIHGIYSTKLTQAMLSKNGGGVSVDTSLLKGQTSAAVWGKEFDLTATCVSQGNRRGAVAIYLDAYHPDILAFMRGKDPFDGGDIESKYRCNIAINISDKFMENLLAGGEHEAKVFRLALELRTSNAGSPYMIFSDAIAKDDPEAYKKHNLRTTFSNLCSEIALGTNDKIGFTCVLSSLNLAKYDQWAKWNSPRTGFSLPFLATLFLDTVCQDFINRAESMEYAECLKPLIMGAKMGRPLGIGAMGWHALLQSKMIPFDSKEADQLNHEVFRHISEEAKAGSRLLADMCGESELAEGMGQRNTHLLAVAPTITNSTINGAVSPGVEPLASNYYVFSGMSGIFARKNPYLAQLIESKGYDEYVTNRIWESVKKQDGSVQGLNGWFTAEEQDVFKTAHEIDQLAIIRQAGARQKYIDQAQSINLFTTPETSPAVVAKWHIEAWKYGLKSLYYVRGKNMKAEVASNKNVLDSNSGNAVVPVAPGECEACDG